MSSIIQLLKNDFYLSFPDIKLSNDDINLRMKCEELGILPEENDTRQEFNFITSDDISTSNSISATDLKAWLNQRGTSDFFTNHSEEEYKNWEKILYSQQDESIILALTMINTKLRPTAKYFSLWVALGQFHSSPAVRTAAKALALTYLTEKEWASLSESKIMSYLNEIYSQTNDDDFISINYVQTWTNSLTTSDIFVKNKYVKYFESKDFFENWGKFKIEDNLPHPHSFVLKINSEDGLEVFHFLAEKFNQEGSIGLTSTSPMEMTAEVWKKFERLSALTLNNIHIDKKLVNILSPLPRVSNFNFSVADKICISSHLFPKVKYFQLSGKSIDYLQLEDKEEKIFLSLSLTETQQIPEEVYNSQAFYSLSLNYKQGVIIDKRIKNLTQLVEITFGGLGCIELSDELFNLPKLVNIFEINHDILKDQISPNKVYPAPNAMILSGEPIREFPYYLSACEKLLQLSLRQHQLTEIDDRVANFKSLFQLSFPDGKMKRIPDSLMEMPRLCWLDLHRQDITKISFEWVVFAYRRKALVNLSGNPIHSLPEIPTDFRVENIIQDEIESLPGERRPGKGWISISQANIPQRQIERYKEVFGEDFLRIY